MLIKMSEYFQGSGVAAVLVRTDSTVNVLAPDETYEVDAVLGAYLLENHKGIEVGPRGGEKKQPKEVHYGAQAEPELAHDEELYNVMITPAQEVEPDEDKQPDKPKKRSKK